MNIKNRQLLINLIPVGKIKHILLNRFIQNEHKIRLKISQKILSKYYDKKSWYRGTYGKCEYGYWSKLLNWLYHENKNKHNIDVLDIGCAYGTLALFCKTQLDANVYALDACEFEKSKQMCDDFGIFFKKCNIEKEEIPYNKKFDIIIFSEVFEHLNFNPIATMIKIKNALKPGGFIYFSTPNAELWGKTTRYYKKFSEIPFYNPEQQNIKSIDDHIWQYNWPELLHVFEASGLVPVKIDYSNGGRHFNIVLGRKEDIVL